jgi:CheY-like chemotaxis protein
MGQLGALTDPAIVVIDLQRPFAELIAFAAALNDAIPSGKLPLVLYGPNTPPSRSEREGVILPERLRILPRPIKPLVLARQISGLVYGDGALLPADAAPRASFDPTMHARHPLAILLVDDNRTNQKLGVKTLARLGYVPDVAGDGRKAVEACCARPYDLVLMDIEMPELDGVEAAAEIIARLGATRPRIIALTANAIAGDREKYLASGMDGYLSKPLGLVELVAELEATGKA